MLTESQVVAAVCRFLTNNGFRVTQQLSETQHGRDILAFAPTGVRQVSVEAKGATSSKATSNRYGKVFNLGQVRHHVAVAVYCAARDVSTGMMAGVAFPQNETHVQCVQEILPALKRLRVEVFWVKPDASVQVEGIWRVWD